MEFHLKKKLFLKDTSLSERFLVSCLTYIRKVTSLSERFMSSKSDVTFFNSTRQPTLKSRSYLYP